MPVPFLTRRRALLTAAAGLATAASAPASQAAACGDAGTILLTVGGLIEKLNRAPFYAKRDPFFEHNNLRFDRARTFSRADLAALGCEAASSEVDGAKRVFEGPSLRAVLAAASPNAQAKAVRLYALDSYAAEFPLADIAAQNWILSLSEGGIPYAIGNYGPLRLVRETSGKLSEEEAQKWVHSIFYIEVIG